MMDTCNNRNGDLVKEYLNLKKDLDDTKSFNNVQRREMDKLFAFVEKKLLKIECKSEIIKREETDKPLVKTGVNTKEVAMKMNAFLKEHNITKTLFNKHVFHLSQSQFSVFCNKPRKLAAYKAKTQERIKRIEEFLNSKRKCERFLEKYANSVNPIDTLELSRRVNQLLKTNSITFQVFNQKIAKTSYNALCKFLRAPKAFTVYQETFQQGILNIDNFLNDEQSVNRFVEENATIDSSKENDCSCSSGSDDDTDDDDDVILLSE